MATMLVRTRMMVTFPVLGMSNEMSQVVLRYLLLKDQSKPTAATKKSVITEISEKFAEAVEKIWLRASLPVHSGNISLK